MSWILWREKVGFISEIELISEFVTRKSKKYELITGNLSEALPVLGAGMKTSVEVFPGHLEVGKDNFHAFFFLPKRQDFELLLSNTFLVFGDDFV
jgi:hypothetical protein